MTDDGRGADEGSRVNWRDGLTIVGALATTTLLVVRIVELRQ